MRSYSLLGTPALFFLVLYLANLPTCIGQEAPAETRPKYDLQEDLAYRAGEQTEYMQTQCRLDVYYPAGVEDFPTLVWFHGGGLRSGKRKVPTELKEQGFAVVAVSYRLHPKVKSPAYIEDAAASVAWTLDHIEEFGGTSDKVFVSGHSAGGYLTSMLGLDPRWLSEFNKHPNEIAGLIPLSGHTITHFTVREERGIDKLQPLVDDMAPLFHVRDDAPPLLLVTGDRELEMLGRYEENAYLWRMMQAAGHKQTELHELEGFNHGEMVKPALQLVVKFIRKHAKASSATKSN